VVHFDVVGSAQGSCMVELGSTVVVCSVFGPREGGRYDCFSATDGRLRGDVKLAPFARKHCRGTFGQGPEEKDVSAWLASALTPALLLNTFPKAVVDVYALVLSAAGSELPALVMAASCALSHAGVQQRDVVLCASVACVPSATDPLGVLLLDPSPEEVRAAMGVATVAALPSCDRVTATRMVGHWPSDGASEAIDACLDACRGLDAVVRAAIREETQRTVPAAHERARQAATNAAIGA
jgi:exosome complex component MTR3